MNNICNHHYKEYNRCNIPNNHIKLKCSSFSGCGKLLKKGLIFRPEDYRNNGWEISCDRIVWEDGAVQDY